MEAEVREAVAGRGALVGRVEQDLGDRGRAGAVEVKVAGVDEAADVGPRSGGVGSASELAEELSRSWTSTTPSPVLS